MVCESLADNAEWKALPSEQRSALFAAAVMHDTRLDVILMSGLPAAGKDRWIADHVPEWPVVSSDAIRRQQNVQPEDDQGSVVAEARRVARAYLQEARPFVWNATNVTALARSRVIGLLQDYRARVRIVYMETSWEELLRRNRARKTSAPEAILEKLARKLDVPKVTEAHRVDYHCA